MPHLKLWLFVNHKPKIEDDSHGFWRRVRLIPFTKQFTGEADDKRLGEKLRAEAPGILAWLVRGCLEWQKRGLEPVPECVKTATEQYRAESDDLSGFLSEKCVERIGSRIRASELYKAFKEWATEQGLRDKEILSANAFGRRMADKYHREKTREGTYYQGLCLNNGDCDAFVTHFEANDTENDVFPICNASHEKTRIIHHNPPQKLKSVTPDNHLEDALDTPDYPTHPCPVCGGDYWLREASQWGSAEWLCSRCHPKPEGNEDAE